MDTTPCLAHDDQPALSRCFACGGALCDECWKQNVDARPACDACVSIVTRPISPIIPIFGVVLLLVVSWLWVSRIDTGPLARQLILGGAALLAIVTAVRRTRRLNFRRAAREVTRRSPSSQLPSGSEHPYRGALRRRFRRLSPPVSGSLAVFIVGSALVLAAAVVPSALHLSRWVAAELVLLCWWIVWTTALGVLLHQGWRVANDGALPDRKEPARAGGWEWSGDFGGPNDLEGLLVVLAGVAVFLLGWAAVDLIFPFLLLGAYLAIVGALGRVANDRHDCEGAPRRALAWGALWATVYTLPLACAVLLLSLAGHLAGR